MRLTQRQVQALWRQVFLVKSLDGSFNVTNTDGDILSHDEMVDLEARLYVAAHPELVGHVIELDVRDDDRDALVRVVENYGAQWRKDDSYYAAAKALGMDVCSRCNGHGMIGNSGSGTVTSCDECGGTGSSEDQS